LCKKVDEQFLPDNFFHILKHFGRYKLALQKGKKDSFMFHLRGHRFKLKIQNFKTSVKSHFLPNRVFTDWNALSDEIVNASNPNIFKNKLDAHFR
jgi:hypothetical protein